MTSPQALAATSPLDLQRALLSGIPSPQEKLIRKDISRTFPKQDYFRQKDGPNGQESLFNVCKAYSLYDPEVNYVQGMAFVVGPLLLNVRLFCSTVTNL